MVNVGVKEEGGEFVWTCGCGATGTPTKDREQARDSFKEHRRSACTSQETVRTTPQETEEVNTMEVLKERATSKKGKGGAKKAGAKSGNSTRERAVTEKEALQVIDKIKAGKGTVMGEARRLGCYHATLRKALRAAVGEKAYAHLMSDKKGKKVSTSSTKKAAAPAKKSGAKKSAAKKSTARKATTRKQAADKPAAVETSVEPTPTVAETAAASVEAGV